ncbi:BPTI/Kunitz domain-containing protein-like [Anolis sagrei]|uniref:BPTI/Kunitz domain-containing protein-like n=1 Tax=Anolis sagrei TaxID=38937 RepID=UPI00352206AF
MRIRAKFSPDPSLFESAVLSGCPVSYPPKCKLSQESGPCMAKFEQFYFDTRSKRCQSFTYSGCGGNENRFVTMLDCLLSCENMDRLPRICSLPKSDGLCYELVLRYYYNTERRRCLPFVYKGCLGNMNNFKTLEECKQKCHQYATWPEACTLQKDNGSCTGSITRFYFDVNSKKCMPFIYGGCQGNKNNFESENECNYICTDFKKF